MKNWENIHTGFGGHLGKEKEKNWKRVGFNYHQVEEWVKAGLTVNQQDIAAYANWRGYQSSINIAILRKEYHQVQNWLDFNYLLEGKCKLLSDYTNYVDNYGKTRDEIKILEGISNKGLEGSLYLEGFTNLEEIYCFENKITKLKLSDCSNLKKINCCNNFLSNIEFLIQLSQPQRLEKLDISDNKFSSQDLNFLTPFINLKQLLLGSNDQKRIQKSFYNRFSGLPWPLQNLTKLEVLDINNNSLEGSLKLEGFANLESFFFINNKLTSLDVSDCSQLRKINCYNNQLTDLDVSKNIQLTNLICSNNQLTNLKFGENNQLTELCCWGNKLKDLDFPSLNSKKLKRLDISNNDFSEQDLSFFSKFIELKSLIIGTYDEKKLARGTHNRFFGSLKFLKDLIKLEELDISNTNINQGVEYLPGSITEVYCSTEERPESKVKEIVWQLKLFESKNQKNWEKSGFNLEEIKSWMETGLEADDYDFADHLKKKKDFTLQEASQQLDELREKYRKENINQQFQEQIQVSIK